MAYKKTVTEDLTGEIFGRLTVIGTDSNTHTRTTLWNCRCQCGNLCSVHAANLIDGVTRSCGCLKREIYGTDAGQPFSGTYGVRRTGKRWNARIAVDGLTFDLGTYSTEEEAVAVRKEAEEHRPNFTPWYCEWLTRRTEDRFQKKLTARKGKGNA